MGSSDLGSVKDRAGPLFQQAGLSGDFTLSRLAGGRNNRVYRVDCGSRSYALKWYHSSTDDGRDRLAAEFAFAKFAATCCPNSLPHPLAQDADQRLALFQWIEGRRLAASELRLSHLQSAAKFIAALNSRRQDSLAQQLPLAAEACFSEGEHLEHVAERVHRLKMIASETPWHSQASNFVRRRLVPQFEEVTTCLRDQLRQSGASDQTLLDASSRCISPSDFGFHNALLTAQGDLVFVDFEYAGWDDPAKLAVDFSCQIQVPAPSQWLPEFHRSLAGLFPNVKSTLARITRLAPLYRIKWCCIVLNEFLPTGAARRRFGNHKSIDLPLQLDKAKSLLECQESRGAREQT